MAEPLHYRPMGSAVYYTPPREFHVRRAVVGLLIALILGAIGSALYAIVLPNIRDPMVRGAAVVVAAAAVGGLGLIPIRYGKIRTTTLAVALATIVSLFCLGVMWIVWTQRLLQRSGYDVSYFQLIRHPIYLLNLIRELAVVGVWKYKEQTVKGFPLVALWLGEATLIIGAGVLAPLHKLTGDEPVCGKCGSTCNPVPDLPRFSIERKDEVIGAIESHDFSALLTHNAPERSRAPQLSVSVHACPVCMETNIVTLDELTWKFNDNTETRQTRPLVKQMLVTAEEMLDLLRVCETIDSKRSAADSGTF